MLGKKKEVPFEECKDLYVTRLHRATGATIGSGSCTVDNMDGERATCGNNTMAGVVVLAQKNDVAVAMGDRRIFLQTKS